jgi:Ankyrin repeats (3 copies)
MSTDSSPVSLLLPDRPNLRHLKDQAKDLLQAGHAQSLTDAQFQIARMYGFASWPKLKAHIDSLEEVGQLKQAIDTNNIERVKLLMSRNPALHRAPMGYGKNGPLTWVAECRVPWEPPGPERLAIAKWMLEDGSDVHQGGDGPLMRAALNRDRIRMMELLVSHGADVNAEWNGDFPILFAACEAVNPVSLKWLLDHGADPNCPKPGRRMTALDYLIGTYPRSPELGNCIELLLDAGGVTRYDVPGVLDMLRGRLDRLAERLNADPALIHRRFPELDCGSTGARRLLLQGATLLHVAAEFGCLEAAKLLLDRGAQVDSRAALDEAGVGGQTPLFHAVSQFDDWGLPVTQLLLDRGADLSVRVKLPGHYDRPDEVVECTPLGYALRFPGVEGKTVELLRERGGVE